MNELLICTIELSKFFDLKTFLQNNLWKKPRLSLLGFGIIILTPFNLVDLVDVNLYDICQCSCEPYVNLSELPILSNEKTTLLKSIDILGRDNFNKNITLELYENGEVVKKMKINR